MATFNINGQASPNISDQAASAGSIYTANTDIVPGRVTANGQHPIRVTRIGMYVSGYGGVAVTCSLQIGAGGTNQFSMPAASSAQATGQRNLDYASCFFADATTTTVSITTYGDAYFGAYRPISKTTEIPGFTIADTSLAGTIDYVQSPTAPRTPGITPGTSSAALTWVTPTTDGESPITNYRIEYTTDPTFATGVVVKNVGDTSADTVTGLTAGSTYYFRIAARNIVTDQYGTWSLYSPTVSALIGSAPSAPQTPACNNAGIPGRLNVSWTAPASTNGSPVIDYTVDYGTDPAFGAFSSVTTTALGRTITGLTPGSTYYFRVKARNSIGTSVASDTVSGIVAARTALDAVQHAAAHVSGGIQVEVRSDGANSQVLTLGYIAFGTGSAFVTIAALPVGAGASQFAAVGGPRNVVIVTDPTGDIYVIGTAGSNPSTVLVLRYERTATTTWTPNGMLSQSLAATGDAIVQYAAAFVPGAGGGPVPTILVLARRAGTTGAGALSYATVSTAAVAASTGPLFVNYGSDPSWLAAPPSGQAYDAGALDVGVMSGTTVAIAANGIAVVTVTNGVVAGVSKSAAGTTLAGEVRVIGINISAFALLYVNGAALAWTFHGSNGSVLGSGSYEGTNAQGGAFATQWDAYYDRVAGVITAYYVADDSSLKLESIDIIPSTYAATAATVLTTTLGAGGSNTPVRVPVGVVDERRVLVTAANLDGGAKSVVAHSDRSGNVAPSAPAAVDIVGFDATAAQLFAWAFGDSNPADAQTAYELEVQRVSDSVNVVATGKVASTTTGHTVAAATLANSVDYLWRVRTWDELDTIGTYSAYDAFATAALGTLTITSPAADNPAGLDTSSLDIAWSYVQGDGYTQTQRRVRVIRVSDSVVLSDTTMQASTAGNHTVTGLPSDVPLRVEVSIVTNAPGTPTVGPIARLLTTSFSAPMTPTAIITTGESYIEVTVDNPAPSGSRPEVAYNYIERRPTGSGDDFVPIALVGLDGTHRDHAVTSGRQYDYRVRGVTA